MKMIIAANSCQIFRNKENSLCLRTRRIFFHFLFLILKFQVLKSEEQVNLFTLSHPLTSIDEDQPYLTIDLPRPLPESKPRTGLTFCSWISVSHFKRPTVLFSLKDAETDIWEISIGLSPTSLLFRRKGKSEVIYLETLPSVKQHICLAIHSRTITLYQDSDIIHNSFFPGTELLGQDLKLFMGGGEQWPDMAPKTFGRPVINDNSFILRSEPKGAFAGSIIAPILLESGLTENEVDKQFRCEAINKLSVTNSWQQHGMHLKNSSISMKEPCTDNRFDFLLLSKPLTYEENKRACQRLQLRMISPDNNKDYDRLTEVTKPYFDTCGRGKWYTWLKPLNGQLEEGQLDNCEALTDSGQERASCNEHLCAGCQIGSEKKLFVLRGICLANDIDLSFVIQKTEENRTFYFQGIERYNIYQIDDTWNLQDEEQNLIMATTKSPVDPIGLKDWVIATDFCGKKRNKIVKGMLVSCNVNEAFCSDGSCIPLSQRCNGFPDCFDASDEVDCESIRKPWKYFSTSPPPPLPFEVVLYISIIKVLSMPPDNYFTLYFETKFSWSDHRINVANINARKTTPLTSNSSLWFPKLSVLTAGRTSPLDAPEADPTAVLRHAYASPKAEGTTLTAITYSNALQDTRQNPYRDTLYSGANVTFTMMELATQNVDCEFDLSFFPFDEQVCTLSLVLSQWPSSQLIIKNPVIGRYTGPARLLHYTVMQTRITNKLIKVDGKIYSGVDLSIHLSRRPSLYVLTVYLPTSFLLLLVFSTLWMAGIKDAFARLQMSCIVLILFVLDWLLMALNAPQPGHLTAVDAWLCFCTTYTLLHIAAHVLLLIFIDESQPDPFSKVHSRVPSSRMRDVKPIDSNSLYEGMLRKFSQTDSSRQWAAPYWILFIARVVSPVLLLFFNSVYWPFVAYFRRTEFG